MRSGPKRTQVLWLLLVLTGLSAPSFAQITVNGTVTDAVSKQTMPGVNVSIKGTTIGTVTDADGIYTLQVQSVDNILVIHSLGYKTEEITVGNQKNIDVSLIQDVVELDQVVVMGYSEKTKSEISSAVATLPMKKLRDITTDNIANMLQGKVAGVEVVKQSGQPGSEAEIRIRGVASANAPKGPLMVVDGIIGGNYDPNDVETITVLKDAGATGMYGSQANGGVIVITTKKGKSDKTQFDFKASIGTGIADQGHLNMMSGSQLYDAQKELYRDYSSGKIDILKFYNERPLELKSLNYQWEEELFQPALLQNYYLSAKKNTEKFAYYVGGTYYNEKGTFEKTGYQRINLRANSTYRFNKWASVENNINLSASEGTTYDYMDMYYAYLSMPWDNPYDSNGNVRYVDGSTTDWWSRDKINPMHTIENSDHSYKGFDVNYDFVLNLKFTKWLSFTSSNRLSALTAKSHNFVSPTAAGTYHDKGFIQEASDLGYGGITTNLFKVNFEIGNHSIGGLIGYEGQGGYNETMSAEGKGLPIGFDVLNVASSEYLIGGMNTKSVMESFISQINYNYKGKYFFSGSYRIDATSSLPPENRTAGFPAASASWLISKEDFLKDSKVLDLLKLRLSYGITGMKDIGAYRYLGLFSLNTQYNNMTAAVPYQLPSPNLTWEKTQQLNLGVDVGLFKRIALNVDIYQNVTKDLLIQVAQPLSVGFEKKWENVGQVTNKGLEITLSAICIKTSAVEWNLDFTFGTNKNKLADIGNPIYQTVNGIAQIYKDGGELYMFVLPKWLGVNSETGAPQWEQVIYDDYGNVLSRQATSDYALATPQEIKSALPQYQGGLGTSLKFKGITLGMTFSYMKGNYVYNFTRRFMDNDGHEPYYNLMQWDDGWSRWTKPGDIATHPSIQNSALSTENSSRYLEEGSYFKIRNITLRYDFPGNIVKKMKLEGLAIAVSGDNVFTFTKYWGQDPEVTVNPSDWQMPGVSDFKYPPTGNLFSR
jgi:TonB-linked SusC/RagA family outer membrane protein